MTIEEDILFWERAASEAHRHGSAYLYLGVAAGLRMSRDHNQESKPLPDMWDGLVRVAKEHGAVMDPGEDEYTFLARMVRGGASSLQMKRSEIR